MKAMKLKIGSCWILFYMILDFGGYAGETVANKIRSSVITDPMLENVKNEMDFEKLTSTDTFIDKTMLMKLLFNPPHYHYVTYPHGFGKTVNLDMVRRFFHFAIDNVTKKEIEDKKANENYKLFKDERLGLRIAKEEAFFERHFGEYPVLYLNFSNVYGDTFKEMVTQIGKEVQKMYETYDYLYDFLAQKSNASTKFERYLADLYYDKFSRLLRGKGSEDDIMESVSILSQLINRYFNKRAILLVDGLDVPIMNAMINDMDYGDTYFFIQSIFSPVFSGVYRVSYALLVGISRMMCASAADEIIELKHFSFWDSHKYAKYFGFTEDEVSKLCDKYGIGAEERTKIKEFFGGYYILNESIYMYNSQDVLNYLNNRTLTNYYMVTNTRNELYKTMEIPDARKEVISFLAHKEIEYDLELNTSLSDLYYFVDFVQRRPADENFNPARFADTFFLENGLLTPTKKNTHKSVLRIVNLKARIEFKKALQNFYLPFNLNLEKHLFAESLREFVEIENHDAYKIKIVQKGIFSIFKNLTEGKSGRKLHIDKGEVFSALYAIITYNIERARINVPVRKLNEHHHQETVVNASFILPSLNGKILLMAKILYESNVTEALRQIEWCVPQEEETNATVIKYLAINVDVNYEVEVLDLPNRHKNTSPVMW